MKTKILLTILSILTFSIFLNAQSIKDTTVKTSAGKNLSLETSSGDVIITKGNNDAVKIKIFSKDYQKENIFIQISSDDNGVKIKSNDNNIKELRFELSVPSEYNIKVSTGGGDLKVSDITGSHKLSTSGGNITIENCKGTLKPVTSGGDIKINSYEGDLKAITSGGDIIISQINGEVDVITSGGNIAVNYTGTNKGIKLLSSGGDIKLIIPENFQADLNLNSSEGDIKVEFDNVSDKKESKSSFKGSINGGGKVINCTTSGGNIFIGKK